MKVLALNSSPRGGGQSKTEWMLDHLVSGMQAAGAEVSLSSMFIPSASWSLIQSAAITMSPVRGVGYILGVTTI